MIRISLLIISMVLVFQCAGCSEDKNLVNPYAYEEQARSELYDLQVCVRMTMYIPDPPIENLETDHRILAYASNPNQPTNIMTNGGLITVGEDYVWSGTPGYDRGDQGSSISLPSQYLSYGRLVSKEESLFYYTVTATGTVTGYYDEYGEKRMPYPQ